MLAYFDICWVLTLPIIYSCYENVSYQLSYDLIVFPIIFRSPIFLRYFFRFKHWLVYILSTEKKIVCTRLTKVKWTIFIFRKMSSFFANIEWLSSFLTLYFVRYWQFVLFMDYRIYLHTLKWHVKVMMTLITKIVVLQCGIKRKEEYIIIFSTEQST